MADKHTKETTEEFSSRIFGIVSGSFTGISIAFGYKTGLFKVLVDHHDTPMTSQEIADVAGLKERYVREWLGVMTTASIVDLDPVTEKYHLPPHRVDSFRSGTMVGHSASCCIAIPEFSQAFPTMIDVVKKDGPRGMTFSMMPNAPEFTEAFSSPWMNECLIQKLIPSQPEIMSKLETGIRTLEVGCGRGAATRKFAERFPNSHAVGLDIDQGEVDRANELAKSLALNNVEYVCSDAAAMPKDWTSTFDYVFIYDVLHDTARPDLIIDEVKRVMKTSGIVSVIEMNADSKQSGNIENPAAPMLYTCSLFYCLPMGYNAPGSMGLGTMWGKDRIREFMKGKGLRVKSETKVPMMPQIHFLLELM
ncbi:S-adenosylmethionine-dependent methyltransferase Rv2258c-like [Lytechinus pictus]|uniref:S-adenosylmethionine-dependent methyltransferase Rv2258c-like n=1 Tax=Lytechinus pictus TaxID=7653 RepID=UPI0030B9BF75